LSANRRCWDLAIPLTSGATCANCDERGRGHAL